MPNRIMEAKRPVLETRAALLHAVTAFFLSRDYLFVETPGRIPSPLPESHIDPIPSGEWWLQPSPELCMKRMLAAGYERIVQISKCWRGHERGALHLPEFSLLEWYRAGTDYRGLMDECEDLFLYIGAALGTGGELTWRGLTVDLSKPWTRLSVREAFSRYASVTLAQALSESTFDEILALEVEPRLAGAKPVFLFDYPLEHGSLARRSPKDPAVAERFEIYLAGLELANGFSELKDPEEQRSRFEKENRVRRERGRPEFPMPGKFLEALPLMPESAGIALGIDRLAMLFTGAETIDAVVAFTPEDL